ncbi:Polygalacturonase 2 [Colletotrichum chlorophyti]|uniref:endo-polygalacturonase n=1 Tax=Colletotrichum chlorophyti TaxID=708187 RepID=A0A1Q8RRC3_9PEZI|nr:Polygalacturonase 2 [Colletotrichum chlorophyti]
MQPNFLALLLASISSVAAVPAPAPTAPPSLEHAAAKRATPCTFSGADGYSLASKNKAACATIVLSALSVPSGVPLNLTGLNDNTVVEFQGTTTFGAKPWPGPLFAVSGKSITIRGSGTLDGQGASYWDGGGSSSGKTKPKFFQAHDLTNSRIQDITILNAPVQVFSINNVKTLHVDSVTINNKAGTSQGKNTDGFDIGSSDSVTITNATVYNQDDCVAINSGTNIVFSGGFCSGGHGLSIGSVGGRSNNKVDGVIFSNSQVVNSENGVRVKTISGDTGSVNNVTYKSITLSGITKNGIIVTQAYNGDTATTGVPITDLILNGVTGSVSSSAKEISIDCGSSSSCSNWSWSGVSVTGGSKGTCTNAPKGVSC